jgi:hypothetical protein
MDSSSTAYGEELPQHILETTHKPVHAEKSHQAISFTLGLKLVVVKQVLTKQPSQMAHDPNYSLVTRSIPTIELFSQSLEGTYLEGSEGTQGLVDHQVHFTVTQLETGDKMSSGELQLHELPCKSFQAQLLH